MQLFWDEGSSAIPIWTFQLKSLNLFFFESFFLYILSGDAHVDRPIAFFSGRCLEQLGSNASNAPPVDDRPTRWPWLVTSGRERLKPLRSGRQQYCDLGRRRCCAGVEMQAAFPRRFTRSWFLRTTTAVGIHIRTL